MPRDNFLLILSALVLYALCSTVSIRDRILVETLHRIESKSLVEPSAKLLFEGAMSGMTRKLNTSLSDVYSAYIPPIDEKEYEEGLENRFDGIGIVYRQDPIGKESEILYPILGSPAHSAGIRSGDKILSVNGTVTKDLPFGDVSELFRGPNHENVKLSLLRFGKTVPETIGVPRGTILRASVDGDRLDSEGNRIFRLETEPELAYLRITTFSDRTAGEVRTALEQIAKDGCRGLVLDLRDNAGGFVITSVEIAGFFLRPTSENDVIVSTRYRDGTAKYAYFIAEGSQICTLPMVVLIDGETASAAEILSAALQDYRRAVVVGTRSFGKGVVQEIFHLPLRSGTLQLTDASYWRPNNQNIHRSRDADENDQWGVTPDPEGLLPASGEQRYAMLQIRERRSNYLSDQTEVLLEDFLKRLPDEVRLYRQELRRYRTATRDDEQDDPDSPFEPEEANETGPDETTIPEPVKENEDDAPFVLQGNAPYYDPQLDRAIEILKEKNNEP